MRDWSGGEISISYRWRSPGGRRFVEEDAGDCSRGTISPVDSSYLFRLQFISSHPKCTQLKGCGLKERNDTEEGESPEEDERANAPLYSNLVIADLETATLDDLISSYSIAGFDLIVAADVLVYFGAIDKLLLNFAQLSNGRVSEKGSFLIFSCERIKDEEAPPAGWKLQSTGRYAHSKSYVVGVAEKAGYVLLSYEEIIPRMENGEEVQGHLFTFGLGKRFEAVPDDEDLDQFVEVESFIEEL